MDKRGFHFLLAACAIGIFIGSLGWALFHPDGIPAAMRSIRDLKQLEQQVQELRDDVSRMRKKVERLRTDPEERDRAIRQHMNMVRPGETTIILPDAASKTESPADAR